MEYLFVYGIFRDASHGLLDGAVFCDKAFIFGRIYQVNEFYPGVKLDKDKIVWGDIYLVDPSIFEDLDEFEGDEYCRRKVWTNVGIEVWIYEYKYAISNFKEIEGGDWILR